MIASMVRSNGSGQVGFLDDRKIFNVLLASAKRALLVLADLRT